jgi:WD40 repeat protein
MRRLWFLTVVVVVLSVAGQAQAEAKMNWHGLTFETLTLDSARSRGLVGVFQGALVTAIEARSPAHDKLKVGDAIVLAGDTPIADAAGLSAVLDAVGAGDAIVLTRMRKDAAPLPVTLTRPLRRRPGERLAEVSKPVLMLDTGGHMAKVKGVIFTRDGKQLISGGHDKVIRVWDVASRRTVRTIRGEVAAGSPGKIFAMTLSQDGRWLAVGGYLGSFTGRKKRIEEEAHKIRIYDFVTGEIVALLKGHTNVVLGLAFSEDGRLLVSGSSDNTAIVWQAPKAGSAADWRRGRMKQVLRGHRGRVFGVGFMPGAERVVTGSYDKTLRVWDVDSGVVHARLLGHEARIFAIDIARDGTLASGDDGGVTRIWPAGLLSSVSGDEEVTQSRVLATTSDVGMLSFSPDGRRLLVGCAARGCRYSQSVWELASGRQISQYDGHNNIVLAGGWHPNGRWVVTGGGNDRHIAIWDADSGALIPGADGRPQRMVGGGKATFATGISEDGEWIAWGSSSRFKSYNSRGPLQYAMRLPLVGGGLPVPVRIDSGAGVPQRWVRARAGHGNWLLQHRRGGQLNKAAGTLDVREGERVHASITRRSSDGYQHRSYGFTPDGATIVSGGSNGALAAYALDGTKRGHYVGHEGAVWAVTPSRDGRFLISGSADQTVRLWNLATRELIVTLFHAPAADGSVGEWVMWTPQGFYTGSAGAGRLVGWQLNNGPDKGADYIIGGQFRRTLNRPDIIEEAIRLASAKAAVARLEPAHNLASLLSARPPTLTLVTPEPYAQEFRGAINVTMFVDQGSFDVTGYEIAVNGIKVPTVRGTVPPDHRRPPSGQIVESVSVPLADGRNTIEIKALSAAGESRAVRLPVDHNGEGPLDKRGKLYVVAIGVDDYQGLGRTCGADEQESCDLAYAGKDARLFMETITRELGPRHALGQWTRLLTKNGRGTTVPTRENILAALDGLAGADTIDTVAVFLAGHGERGRDGRYYFLPTDISRDGGFSAIGGGSNIIEWSEIQERLTAAKGRRMVFVDSCQSGALGAAKAYNGRLLEDAQYDNFVAFMAAGRNQAAIENDSVGNGLFTHALAKGIRGAALQRGERAIRVLPLGSYVANEVWALSGGRQRPVYTPHADFVLSAH